MVRTAFSRQSDRIKDYRASLEKLRKDAAEAALIRDLAIDIGKREMFNRLLQPTCREVERTMSTPKTV
jgi:hypothetical protein